MATNERFTIERSELTNGNFECVRQTEGTEDVSPPESPPEVTIAILLVGLIREGAVV